MGMEQTYLTLDEVAAELRESIETVRTLCVRYERGLEGGLRSYHFGAVPEPEAKRKIVAFCGPIWKSSNNRARSSSTTTRPHGHARQFTALSEQRLGGMSEQAVKAGALMRRRSPAKYKHDLIYCPRHALAVCGADRESATPVPLKQAGCLVDPSGHHATPHLPSTNLPRNLDHTAQEQRSDSVLPIGSRSRPETPSHQEHVRHRPGDVDPITDREIVDAQPISG